MMTSRRTVYVDDYEVVATEVGRGNCYPIKQIEKWKAIDDYHLYVEDAESSAAYIVTTKSNCKEMLSSRVFALGRGPGLVCQNESRVAYRYGDVWHSCGIDNIEVVENQDAAMALVRSRTRVDEGSIIDFILKRESRITEEVD